MFCRQCGRELPEGARFCTKCGYQIKGKGQSLQKAGKNLSHGSVFVLGLTAFIAVVVIMGVMLNADRIAEWILLDDLQKEDAADLVFEKETLDGVALEDKKDTEVNTIQETEDAQLEQMINKMRNLFDNNLYCVFELFYFGNHLETTGENCGYNLMRVKNDKFNSYSAYEVFLRTTYTSDIVQELITPAKYMCGSNGELCLNMAFVESGQFYDVSDYYVDWSGYQLAVDSYSEKECYFTVTVSENNGSNENVYECRGKAVYQNGNWLLTKVIY